MHINLRFKNQKGIGLVEVMAAFSISVVVITSLVGLALYTMRSALQSKMLLESTKIAQREIERVRSFRDQSLTWTDFYNGMNTVGCMCNYAASGCAAAVTCNMASTGNLATVSYSPASGTATEVIDNESVTYSFSVMKDQTYPNDILRVGVTVTWQVGPISKNTHVYTDLSNWQVK